MEWVVVGVESSVPWPTKDTEVQFGPYRLTMRAETESLAPSVIMQYPPPETMEEAILVVRRFLSSLSWVDGYPIRETMATGGSHPIGVGKSPLESTRAIHFRADYLPYSEERRVQLALALYREALAVNSVPYSFLGFAKILNILYAEPHRQIEWSNAVIDKIQDHRARERLTELSKRVSDIGRYLYGSGRSAVAHAFCDPVVDPEVPKDLLRMNQDLPVIRALAAYLIENELGVRSGQAVWREHLYELEGFRQLIGHENAATLRRRETIDLRTTPVWPKLSIRIRDHEHFAPFEGMTVARVFVLSMLGVLQLKCTSGDGLVTIEFDLDFPNERIFAGPEMDVRIRDDASEVAVKHAIAHQQFRKAYYSNGELEIMDADTGQRLGRCDPYLPVNIDLAGTDALIDSKIDQLRKEGQRRHGRLYHDSAKLAK